MRNGTTDKMRTLRTHVCLALLLAAMLVCMTACSVHEFPSVPTHTDAVLHLRFDTDMPQTDCYVSRGAESRIDYSPVRTEGKMRCIVRLYPKDVNGNANTSVMYKEYTVTRDISQGYDFDMNIDAPVGLYTVMVWADLSDSADGTSPFYTVSDFSEITLTEPYMGSTDYRDAFRGVTTANITASEDEQPAVEVTVDMERPLAKFEFVSNDLRAFMEQQSKAAESKAKVSDKTGAARSISLDQFRFVFSYSGYMPCSYSMFTDKPVDAKTGVTFRGRISQLSDDEASVGFDYVFVNHQTTEVTVQLGIYDADGNLISVSDPVNVPLQRNRHTIVRGKFLTQKSTGGVRINTQYSGEYNITL